MISRADYASPRLDGGLGLPYHYEMLADDGRIAAFKQAIEMTCRNQIVLESGTGSGILSLLAARAGARKVYTFDIDPGVGSVARSNILESGLDNVVFVERDLFDVGLADLDGQPASVVIAENLSTWLVTEPQVRVLNHVNGRLASENAVRLPSEVGNHLQLAESRYRFEDLVTVRTHYFEFSGIPGPRILSDRCLFQLVDLRMPNPTTIEGMIEVDSVRDGTLNSLRLTSPIRIYREVGFEGSDSLMPPVVVPLQEDVRVRRGDRVRLQIRYQTSSSWERFFCSAERLG